MRDPRATSSTMIRPPGPLPYVSRKALARVKDVMPIPTECPYCQGPVVLTHNSEIYHGKSYGHWPYVYLCQPCNAYVGLHPDTNLPLGTLATRALREARFAGKHQFIELSKRRGWTRNQSYAWLAQAMGISKETCHWAWFTITQANHAKALCREHLDSLRSGR